MSPPKDDKPKMVEIPDRDNFEKFAQKNMSKGYAGLNYAYQSYKLGRSTNEATILLLGLTGAGKSHTINNLFNKEITLIGDGVSCTKDIVEFSIELESEDTGISNARLTVLDTPGFGDTQDGLEFDAKVLANLNKFFGERKYFPNFIILTVNINDKRLDGKFAPFVKLLQAMKRQLTKVVLDHANPNIVVVLTHLCGSLPKLQRDPSAKKNLVQKIIQENLGIPNVPVEVAENCVDEYELEKSGDYFILPNKELFPRNIYVAMKNLAKNLDPVGHGIINEAYDRLRTEDFSIRKRNFPILDISNAEVTELVDELLRQTISTTTELGDCLVDGWGNLSDTEKTKSRLTPTEFASKLAILGYRKKTELPRNRKDTANFFRELAPDQGMEILLRKSLGLEAPQWSIDLFAGRAFDITKDNTTSFIVLQHGNQVLSTVGCYIPEHIRASICPEVKFTCNITKTAREMVEQRMRELKVQVSVGNIGGFNYGHRSGYNIVSQGSTNTLTAVYEKRLIKLETSHSAPYSQELQSAAQSLPTTYNKHDLDNVNTWKRFFSSYGTHFINTSYIGGSVTFSISQVDGSDASSKFQIHQGGLGGFVKSIFGSAEYTDSSSSSNSSSFRRDQLAVTVQGGNSSAASYLSTSQTQAEFMDRLAKWEDTIWENPMVTDASIHLAEVADVVNRFNSGVVNAMKAATVDLYNASLVYEKLPEPTRKEDREENKPDEGSSCLTAETLISTPTGQVRIDSLSPGDAVLDGRGNKVQVIGVNKTYSLGNNRLWGFKDLPGGSTPFFTGGHTFVTPTGDLLVQNKSQLEQTHPQMRSELFKVQEMPTTNVEVLVLQNGQVKPKVVPSLTSNGVEPEQELYFLVVQGDGTYVANGVACYHELPKFEAWPKTFSVIFEIASLLDQTKTQKEMSVEDFKQLVKMAREIEMKWNLTINNKNSQGNPGEEKTFELGNPMEKLASCINDPLKANFGSILYSCCGDFLHKHLDVGGGVISGLVASATEILLNKDNC